MEKPMSFWLESIYVAPLSLGGERDSTRALPEFGGASGVTPPGVIPFLPDYSGVR